MSLFKKPNSPVEAVLGLFRKGHTYCIFRDLLIRIYPDSGFLCFVTSVFFFHKSLVNSSRFRVAVGRAAAV